MTVATMPHLAPALQEVIDFRLNTIDRVLLDRVPRPERIGIVEEVEAQILELLAGRGADELTRDDVLAVLARLDPPEAYIPEQPAQQTSAPSGAERRASTQNARATEPRIGIAGGIVGVSALGLTLLMPLSYLLAAVIGSAELMILGLMLAAGLMGLGGLLGLVFSLCARLRGAWSVVGAVTGALAMLLSLSGGMFLLVNA